MGSLIFAFHSSMRPGWCVGGNRVWLSEPAFSIFPPWPIGGPRSAPSPLITMVGNQCFLKMAASPCLTWSL